MGMRDKAKKRTKTIRVAFNQGGRTDTDPIAAPILRTMNVFLSPDGTEAGPREGATIYKNYYVQATSPVDRKVIIVDRQPYKADRTMHMIASSKTNSIEYIHFSRDESGEDSIVSIHPDYLEDVPSDPGGAATFDIVFLRRGNLNQSVSVNAFILDNSALFPPYETVWVEEVEAQGLIVFAAGVTSVTQSFDLTNPDSLGVYQFLLSIRNPSANTKIDPDFSVSNMSIDSGL